MRARCLPFSIFNAARVFSMERTFAADPPELKRARARAMQQGARDTRCYFMYTDNVPRRNKFRRESHKSCEAPRRTPPSSR